MVINDYICTGFEDKKIILKKSQIFFAKKNKVFNFANR